MGYFGQDLLSSLFGQSKRDKEKKARQDAERVADPLIAARISQYRQKYPWLTPGAALAPAQAGLDVNDPALDRIAQLTAKRKVDKGQGWFSTGQRPLLSMNGLDILGHSLKDILHDTGEVLKPAVKWTMTALQAGPEGAQATVRHTAKSMDEGGILAPVKEFISNPSGVDFKGANKIGLKQDFSKSETTFAAAMTSLQAGHGAGIGQGYLPRGPAVEEQKRRARETQFLEYADHPLFTLPGYQSETSQHAGTLGRNLSKDVFQPGSRPFNLLSGIIDAGFVTVTDPFAKVGKAISTLREGRTVFSAAEMGLSQTDNLAEETARVVANPRTGAEAIGRAPSATRPFDALDEYLPGMDPRKLEVGMVEGVRPAIHPPTTQNWLTQSAPGRKFTSWVADNNDAYSIWKTLGGEKGNIAPDLAARMADTRTTDDVLNVLGDELGVGLHSKPITSRFQPVGGYLGEVKNSAMSNRLLNSMPHSAVHLEDADESAIQLVRLLRNGKLPEDDIGLLFNNLARATTTSDRGKVFMDAEVILADHIASTLTGPVSGRPVNFARLRGVFEKDLDAIQAVYQRQIGTNTEIKALDIDGQSIRLRSIHEDAEYFDTFYQLPDARAMRRITSQYGRLLNNKYLDAPIGLLDHMSSVWKELTILRPALTLRVVGEEQVRMGAAGLDSVFRHPLSAIAWTAGRKGDIDVLGDTFNAADELTAFAKSQAKSATWRDRATSELKSVIPFTDPRFVKSWGNDIYRFNQDDIARRLAAGEDMDAIKTWLKSDEASTYRLANDDISIDAADGYVENLNNWVKGKTYGNQSLLDSIATGQFNGNPIFSTTDQGHRTLSTAFQNHLSSLVDKDISPDHTISDLGDIVYPRNSQQAKDIRGHVTDKLFNTLLTRPSNYLSRSPTFRQNYWKEIERGFIHGSKETQAETIENAVKANLDKGVIKRLRDISSRAHGDLTTDELDMFAKGHALSATKALLYDLSDRNQLLDVLRLVFPFGEAWKEVMSTWAKLTISNPAIIPRAEMTIRGARGSGFFYTDPATGQEMFNYPGGQFVTKHLPGVGLPLPISAAAGSLNMFSNNPLLPGFGPLVQVPVAHLLPDTPKNDFVRSVILPYGEPGSPLPSWAQKLTTAFSDPEKNVAYANTVMDVARYLVSTGEYDTSTDAGKQALEDAARSKAKLLYIFRGIAQAGLPAAPSYQDIAQDKDGHTTLAFTLTDRYRQLQTEDDDNNTTVAVQRFIDEFGMDNLLYMQSASKGGDVFSRSGYNWVRDNPTIVSRYPDIYGLIAPNDGGFDIKAYQALFENGSRKVLPLDEALSLANHRAGKMILRNAQSKLPPPSKRTDAQRVWLDDIKARLTKTFPGFDAEYQGSDIPNKIAELQRAVEDPLLARQPVTGAIRAYLTARAQVEAIARSRKPPILGWQTAKSMKPQRQWLREVADKISGRTPQFLNIYDDLFDNELITEEGA